MDIKLLMSLGFAVLNLVVVGSGAFMVYSATLGFHYPEEREETAMEALQKERKGSDDLEPVLYTMDKFTVNLAGTPRRMIRLEMSLEMLDKEGFEEVVRLGSEARDAIVKVLSQKEFTDIETIQGKLFLKDEIAVTLSAFHQFRRRRLCLA